MEILFGTVIMMYFGWIINFFYVGKIQSAESEISTLKLIGVMLGFIGMGIVLFLYLILLKL